MNAIKTARVIRRATVRCINYTLAPYCVMDNYGTYQYCWTLDTAMAWIKYCGPIACIVNMYTGNTVACRIQG